MKTKLLIQTTVLGVALTIGMAARADYIPNVQIRNAPGFNQGGLQSVAFRDTTEAKMLLDAYSILSTGDHDYSGHRQGAMQQVRAAADLLGLDMGGDSHGGKTQPLSDDRMREAKELIVKVRDSAAVKGQDRVTKHLNEAVHQINTALGIK